MCRSSSIDRDTNIISLLDVIEEITFSSDLTSTGIKDLEIIQLPFELVTMWQRDGSIEKELSANIKLVGITPKGKETEIGPIPIIFEKGKPRIRVRIKINGITFNGLGVYKFKVLLEEKGKFVKVQEIPLEIKASMKI